MHADPSKRFAILTIASVLAGCKPKCIGQGFLQISLSTAAPLQADYQEPLYLYATTTRVDTGASVFDRTEFEWDGKGHWFIEDPVAAPPLADCRDAFHYRRFYAYDIRFEFGTADGPIADDPQHMPVAFSISEGQWSHALWDGLQLDGHLIALGIPNVPVDTGTW